MAYEITLTASISVYKPSIMSSPIGRAVSGLLLNMTGNFVQQGTQFIFTTVTQLALGNVTAPHWAVFHNLDTANFIKLRNGSAGADFLQLNAYEWAFCPLVSTCVPYAIADTTACYLEYLIFTL